MSDLLRKKLLTASNLPVVSSTMSEHLGRGDAFAEPRPSMSPRTRLLSKVATLDALTTGAIAEMMHDGSMPHSEIDRMASGSMEQAYSTIDKVARQVGKTREGLQETWEQALEAISNWARAVARQWVAPSPDQLVTANNSETFAMAFTHFVATLAEFELTREESDEERMGLWEALGGHVPEFGRVYKRCMDFTEMVAGSGANGSLSDQFTEFAYPWRASSYARLEIGHKLAAALCLTDTDGVEVRAPWQACSIVVPDNLFEKIDGKESIARIWCLGTEIKFVVLDSGSIVVPPSRETSNQRVRDFQKLLDNLVRGAFLALENPEEHRKKSPGGSSSKKNQRSGPPDMARALYMLSTPVSIDLRETLREFQSGKRAGGGVPKVQFLVRGHWRQQAHGAGRALRKTIWIQPFWKGDEEARVLLRNYKVKDDK